MIYEIPPAVAKAAMDSGVALEPIEDWDRYREELMERSGTGGKKSDCYTTEQKANQNELYLLKQII